MANNFKLTNAAASAAADAVCTQCNSGKLRIYDGAQPSAADDAITTQVLLAELTFGNPAFAASVNGVATANAISPDTSADATGVAAWFRAMKSDGTTKVFDGSVGTSGADLNLNSVNIGQGAQVSVTALTDTQPKA